MRRPLLVLVFLVLAVLGYMAWPIITLGQLGRALEARDIPAVMSHVHVAAVRSSLTRQVMETYLKLTGKVSNPLLRGIVVDAAGTLADPFIDEMVNPEGLMELLRNGWPRGLPQERPAGTGGLGGANLGSAWRIYSDARYGLRRFELDVPQGAPLEQRFTVEFRLIAWRWLLADVRLPEYLRVQLAQMLIKSQSKR